MADESPELKTYHGLGQLTLERGDEGLKDYEFAACSMAHKFCGICGTGVYGKRHGAPEGQNLGLNARTLQGVDLWALDVNKYDGKKLPPAFEPAVYTGLEPTAELENAKVYTGACHCGEVTLALKSKGLLKEGDLHIQECNCSICSRNGTILTYPSSDQVQISGADKLTSYIFGRRFQSHEFCSTCGVSIYIKKLDVTDEMWAKNATKKSKEEWKKVCPINLRCFEGVEWEKIEVKKGYYKEVGENLGIVFHEIWQWTLEQARKNGTSYETISHNYGTPVVGETADWWMNDAHKTALKAEHVQHAFANAMTQTEVQEGQYGGGAGMTCHMFPGGTGTSSRVVSGHGEEKYTVGVICQSNYGYTSDLQIGGVPIGKLVLKEKGSPVHESPNAKASFSRGGGGKADEGSIVIYLITDAPVLPHQLTRMARHCAVGLAQVGGHGIGSNHSGDIILCLSTANKPVERVMTPRVNGVTLIEKNQIEIIKNESIDAMFRAASEATEEAILNSMIAGRDGRTGFEGIHFDGLPVDLVKEMLKKYRVEV
ncbi:hypothetical protein EG329_013944 [Mollisiaceae sp. DMI_Dod_QoI]|nr:hypothetical protein EG329_013944 [Helotiales sp. DMI_Dod_QoI]